MSAFDKADHAKIREMGIRTIESTEDGGELGNAEWCDWIWDTVAAANGHPVNSGEHMAIQMAVLLDRTARAAEDRSVAALERVREVRERLHLIRRSTDPFHLAIDIGEALDLALEGTEPVK